MSELLPTPPTLDVSQSKVLVVDDDKYIRQIMKRYLDREGFQLELVEDGRQAIQLLESYRPDVVISDWMMPEVDGLDLCRWIRQNEELSNVYFILLTSKDSVEDKTLGLEAGANDYVTKPFQGAELIARVRSGLRLRAMQQELSTAYKQLDEEFQVVADLQKSMLPSEPPRKGDLEFSSHYSPSLRAGGDYYDFIPVSDLHLGILVADVSGHGASASMLMAITRVVMRAFVQDLLSPGGALTLANDVLHEHVPTDQFATAFYGIVNLRTNRMVYSSAGHNPPLLYRHETGQVEELKNTGGIPLKILPHTRYEEGEVVLLPGDHLFLYTDGLTEAFNPDQDMFGEEALSGLLRKYGNSSPVDLTREIWRSVHSFVRNEPFHDDVTMVAIRRKLEE
jgi:serine phosphatase RsbU (regulator of sigma subunit)